MKSFQILIYRKNV